MSILPSKNKLLLSAIAALFLTTPAWAGRADKGASSYGQDTAPCPAGSGPQSPTAFGAITVNCFGPGSGVGSATLFELTNNKASFPSTFAVTVDFLQPSSTDYGLITCDNGNIPCTNKDSNIGPINPVDFSGNPAFGTDSAVFTFSNFTGELAFYINEAATITNVTAATATPEPRSTAILGMLLLACFALLRRLVKERHSHR